MSWDSALFVLAAALSLGWSIVNGMRRRDQKYKISIRESASHLPEPTRRRFLRLVAPTRLDDRINHALVIAGCCLIIYFPVAVLAILLRLVFWWTPWVIGLAGTILGAFIGEFVFYARGCEALPQDSANQPLSTPWAGTEYSNRADRTE